MEEQTQQRTTSSVRLRFVLGQRTAELALPAEVPLADLLPAILLQFGAETIEEGAEHEGWVLQRLGEEPLDEDRSPGQLNLLDGESIYLAPRADQLAAIDYDDLVDGVGDRVREHPGKLTPTGVRRMFEAGALVLLLSGLYLLPGAGAPAVQAQFVGGSAILLLLVSALVARGSGSSRAAIILVGGGVCYAVLSAWLIVGVLAPTAPLMVQITAMRRGWVDRPDRRTGGGRRRGAPVHAAGSSSASPWRSPGCSDPSSRSAPHRPPESASPFRSSWGCSSDRRRSACRA